MAHMRSLRLFLDPVLEVLSLEYQVEVVLILEVVEEADDAVMDGDPVQLDRLPELLYLRQGHVFLRYDFDVDFAHRLPILASDNAELAFFKFRRPPLDALENVVHVHG